MNFLKKWLFHLELSNAQHRCQGTFFSGGNFTPIFEAKNGALYSKNVQAILTLLNLAQKVPFLENLKKKVSKTDWNQRHYVCYPNTLLYMVLDHLWAKKCNNFWQKL